MFMLLFNFPLIIFAFFKIGKRFSILTAVFFVVNTFSYFIFSTYIPKDLSFFEISNLSDTGTRVIAAFVSGGIYGIFLSFTYMVQGSAAGIDVLSFFYSKNNKPFAVYNITFSTAMLFITVFVSEFLKKGLNEND